MKKGLFFLIIFSFVFAAYSQSISIPEWGIIYKDYAIRITVINFGKGVDLTEAGYPGKKATIVPINIKPLSDAQDMVIDRRKNVLYAFLKSGRRIRNLRLGYLPVEKPMGSPLIICSSLYGSQTGMYFLPGNISPEQINYFALWIDGKYLYIYRLPQKSSTY